MFKIGQKVVCKKAQKGASGIPYGIKEGNVYTIEAFVSCKCCNEKALVLIEATSSSKKNCPKCLAVGIFPNNAFVEWRFEPLKYDIIPNKLVIQEQIEERADIPTLEPVAINAL
jgi:hypothetical protein